MTKAAHQQAGRKKICDVTLSTLNDGAVEAAGLRAIADELRSQALNIKSEGLPIFGSVYGVVIDTGYEDRVTSLVALSDGSVSWYVSTGQGCIGCGDDVEVRQAAKRLVECATALAPCCVLTADGLAPSDGRVRIFLLSMTGLMLIDEDMDVVSRAPASQAAAHVSPLVAVYVDSQRLMQLIERRNAGVSLEQEVAALVAATPQSSPNFKSSEKKECLSVGNVARHLAI